MSEVSIIAICLFLPALVLLIWGGFTLWARSRRAVGVVASPTQPTLPDGSIQQQVQLILKTLALEHNYPQALQLLIMYGKDQPDLWFALRQAMTSVSRQTVPEASFQQLYQEALAYLGKDAQGQAEMLASMYTVLLGSSWQLQLTLPASSEAAYTWQALGLGYQYMARIMPESAGGCRETAFQCYFHALNSYQELEQIPEQVGVLFQLADLFTQKNAAPGADPLAYWQARLDCYIQVQTLLKYSPTAPFNVLSEVYLGQGQANYELYKQLHLENYLQQAWQAYNELHQLYTQQPEQDQAALAALQAHLQQISQELELLAHHVSPASRTSQAASN
ncbi:MAG TPA: hypothetical protein VGD98_10200 [Ktedonobacteraceae bacterium]